MAIAKQLYGYIEQLEMDRIKISIIQDKNQHMGFDEWIKYFKMRLYGYNVIILYCKDI